MNAPQPDSTSAAGRIGGGHSGGLHAIAAYTLWGLFPLYWKLLEGTPLAETLAHRVLWSLVTIVLLLAVTGGLADLRKTLADGPKARMLGLTALLIGANWSFYIYAVYSHQVVQASLGYYINPLVSVGLGIAVLRERLNPFQLAAVLLAAIGVAVMAWEHRGLPLLSLGLAATFALYGLLKKRLVVAPLTGLAAETLWLTPLAAVTLVALAVTPEMASPAASLGSSLGTSLGGSQSASGSAPSAFLSSWKTALLLIGTGAVTLAPLYFFNGAARRLRLSTLGFFQYLSPSIQLLLAVVLYREPFTAMHGIAFGCIWAGLLVYSWDGIRSARRAGP